MRRGLCRSLHNSAARSLWSQFISPCVAAKVNRCLPLLHPPFLHGSPPHTQPHTSMSALICMTGTVLNTYTQTFCGVYAAAALNQTQQVGAACGPQENTKKRWGIIISCYPPSTPRLVAIRWSQNKEVSEAHRNHTNPENEAATWAQLYPNNTLSFRAGTEN